MKERYSLSSKTVSSVFLESIMTPFFILLIILLFSTIIIIISGYNPGNAFMGLLQFPVGDMASFAIVLNRSMALIMAGLAVVVAFQAGFFNIGVEGQIYLGAAAAAVAGYKLINLPFIIHLPLTLIIGMFFGSIGAFIPAILKTKLKVDEVITCIMLNSIYVLFTGYLATHPFRDPERWSGTTPPIVESAKLPYLVENISLSSGILFSVIIAIVLYFIMRYSNIGYKWKITGLNPQFARYSGIDVPKVQLSAAIISGALAGLTGSLLVCGTQHRFWLQIGGGIGWDGVLIGMLAMNNPITVVIAGFTFAFLKTGSLGMELTSHVPSELIDISLAFLILIVTGRDFITRYTQNTLKWIRRR